jgi:phosphoribosylformimino-5-aminoimidazole carboxamide ribotide isomerase
VIVMTLAAVGGGGGPDLERLRQVIGLADGRAVYAAGGVRGRGDLLDLQTLGCAGVLVASALHDGRLGQAELAAFG